jgi:hypothetical protein
MHAAYVKPPQGNVTGVLFFPQQEFSNEVGAQKEKDANAIRSSVSNREEQMAGGLVRNSMVL